MARLAMIGLIWLGCSIAWWILGSSLTMRSADTTDARGEEVHGLWGSPLHESPPLASYTEESVRIETETVQREGEAPVVTKTERVVSHDFDVPLQASDVHADFELEHRRRGLLWFATYLVDFDAKYTFQNPSDAPQRVTMRLDLETSTRTYDGLEIQDDAGELVAYTLDGGTVLWTQDFGPRQKRSTRVAFRTRGTGSWTYTAAPGSDEARNFRLAITTNFPNVDFPLNSVSPTKHAATDRDWRGDWDFESLITSSPIGISMPEKLNPGPLAARITFFAPISLLFFFFVITVLSITSGRNLHPMHYFLVGCAFFAFHLLFAYSVDHISLAWSFFASAVVSVLLVVTYVHHFVGWQFAVARVAPTQLLYLVLFSASFFWEGFTGLAITIGAILTLFAVMQMTGRLDWDQTFASVKAKPSSAPG